MPDQPPKPPPRRPGRKPKLTPELLEQITTSIAAAATFRDACLISGVDESTGYRWLQKGEGQKRGLYRKFRDSIEVAKAQRRTTLKAKIRQHGNRDWRALQALGAITDPEEFVPQLRVHVTSQLDAAIARLKEAFADDPEGYERALHALAGGTSSARTAEGEKPADREDPPAGG